MLSLPLIIVDAVKHISNAFEYLMCDEQQIPASFVRCSDSRIGKVVTLEGPSKENWSVEVGPGTLQRSGLEFRDGWQKFVADHNVQIGDHLFFTLKSYSRFQVMVYTDHS